MTTRWEATTTANLLTPADFLYLTDGPRAGETVQARAHTGKIVIGQAANIPPRLGAELVYEDAHTRTSEGARCYRFVPPRRPMDENPHSS